MTDQRDGDRPGQGLEAAFRLKESESRLELALETADMGVFEVDVDTGACRVSGNWAGRLGYGDGPKPLTFWINLVHPDDLAQHAADRRAIVERTSETIVNEHRVKRADGSYIWLLMRAKASHIDDQGRVRRLIATVIDITDRKNDELRVAHMAEHDALTGLPNRYLFRRYLDQAIVRATSAAETFAVLVCDLDRFKTVNDTRGHVVGDKLLCVTGERIRKTVKSTDLVARLGGDEFAVIVGHVDESGAAETCRRIIEAMKEPVHIDDSVFHIGASVGAALLGEEHADAEEIFKRADIALYEAKGGGRNTYCMFEAATHARVQARSLLALDIREAVRREQFYLLYQPVVDLRTGKVTSFEALARWQHPVRGLVSPAEFIPIAEETGIIASLGEWALRQACHEAARWPDDVRVAVNVSTVQFGRDLEAAVRAALSAARLAPERLTLEVTESALIDDGKAASAMLDRLRSLGVRIALDDFGTGYSSLSYLRRFRFDKIKIDRSFIKDIHDNDVSAIVQAVVGIGERLGIGIIAEGVETQDQLDLVTREGCQEVQGFFFSQPRQAHELMSWVPFCDGTKSNNLNHDAGGQAGFN